MTHAARLVDRNAFALHRSGANHALVYPIVRIEDYVSVLHELGHFRASRGFSLDTLEAEVQAWEYARSVALVWDRRAQDEMRRSIESYMDKARAEAGGNPKATQLFGALRVDRLLSARAFAEERQRRLRLELKGASR